MLHLCSQPCDGGLVLAFNWTTHNVATIGLRRKEEHLGEVESPVEMFECDLKRLSILRRLDTDILRLSILRRLSITKLVNMFI